MELTQAAVATLSLRPSQSELFVWDDDLKGFGIRIRATKRVWVIQYRYGTKQRRLTLADIDKLDAAKARKEAKDRLAAVQLGRDPQAEKTADRARASITLGAKIDDYLAIKRKKLRETTIRNMEGSLKGYWRPLHGMELHRITKADVLELGRGLALEHTFSCIDPHDGHHCGRCNKCAERRQAFAALSLEDRTEYADR